MSSRARHYSSATSRQPPSSCLLASWRDPRRGIGPVFAGRRRVDECLQARFGPLGGAVFGGSESKTVIIPVHEDVERAHGERREIADAASTADSPHGAPADTLSDGQSGFDT